MAICNRLVKLPLLFKEGTDFMRSIKSGVVKLRFNFFYLPCDTFKRSLVFEAQQLYFYTF